MTDRYICIHGHFYQPPRENPWLGEVEPEDSARPFHDWNERITTECYAPNAAARILGPDEDVACTVNNYSKMSFNFGPTLLAWMERHRPEVYGSILEADRMSLERFSGHGSAMAQVYNHVIMPLASRRDKVTQVRWGIQDFLHRFGRRPEGMWLPETAVDLESLEILAEHGIAFTILAPHQAGRARRIGCVDWQDGKSGGLDLTMPYLCNLPSGRSIHLFFYDGAVAHDISFGDLLKDGARFLERLMGAFPKGRDGAGLVHVASDGENYGHHRRFGEMALAFCLHHIEEGERARMTNYGEYIEKHPASHEVEIMENTSWSCAHGVERWRSDCGCSSGAQPGLHQRWRAPLREAVDRLGERLGTLYEREMGLLAPDPWRARDASIDLVLDRSAPGGELFFAEHARPGLSREEKDRALVLLEMQRQGMFTFTSCGWFFDDVSGIEPVQVMRHAARAMQLAAEVSGEELEREFMAALERAPSNTAEAENGARVYEARVRPKVFV